MPLDPQLTEFTTESPVPASFDAIDFVTGLGLKKFYLLGTQLTGGVEYSLTTDNTIQADTGNNKFGANATVNADFDIKFEKPFTIEAAEGTVSCTVTIAGAATLTITATIYHVDAAAAETQIGVVVFPTSSGDGSHRRTGKFTFTRADFKIGETLRVTLDTVSTSAGTQTYIDPSGSIPLTGTISEALTSTFILTVPFKRDD